jgi:hypothetical protein
MKMEAAMTYSSWHQGRLPLADWMGERLVRNVKRRDRIVAVLTNPDLVAVVTICAIGLLVTFVPFLLVPSSREIPALIQQML